MNGAVITGMAGTNLLVKGCARRKEYDLMIIGGTVYDGTGTPGKELDIAVRDGKIVMIGQAFDTNKAAEVIDAGGIKKCILVDGPVASFGEIRGFTLTNSGEGFDDGLVNCGVFLHTNGVGNWRVTATPSADWIVTSLNPQYANINFDNAEALDVNFCVAKVGTWTGPVFPVHPIYPGGGVDVVLPESGAPASSSNVGLLTAVVALGGLGFIMLGVGLEVKRRRF